MSEQGWFAVDRAIWGHVAFADEKFSEREAFLWLVSEAAYKPWKVRVGSDVMEIQRGQLSHSLRFMARKWKWPEPRVRRYLDRLKKHEIILIEVWSKNDARGDARQTVITICNYEEYQSHILEGDAGGDARPTRERRASDAKKNKETNKQDKDISKRAHAWPDGYLDIVWDLYPKKAEKKDGMAALEAVYKTDKVPFEVIRAGIEKLISHVDPQYHPALHRWLKKERWNDEFQPKGVPRQAGDLFSNSGDTNASAHHNRTGQTAFGGRPTTGVDAVGAALAARKARRAQSMGGGDLEGREEHPDDPGIIDAQWADASGS